MMQSRIKIFTLQGFYIERDGQLLDNFISSKAMLLLLYLVLNPTAHSREYLASLFWSETSNEQALKNLRTVLSSLRKEIGDTLDIGRKRIAIKNREDFWLDADYLYTCFEDILDKEISDLAILEPLLKLYQNDFLSDVRVRQADEFDIWVQQYRAIIKQMYQQLLLQIVEICISNEDYLKGLQYARQLEVLDPLWENTQRHIMCLLTRIGQSHEALLQFEQFSALLMAELGAKPEVETIRLYKRIRDNKFDDNTVMQGIANPNFIVPAKECEQVKALLDNPQSQLITLAGLPGAGKTSLARQILYERHRFYQDGAIFVSLVSLDSEAQLAQTILNSLKLPLPSNGQSPDDMLIDYLQEREMLLVLDNYEHLLPGTALLERIVNEVPSLQMILTSQSPLNLLNEWIVNVRGLSVTDTEAQRLFEVTAQRLVPDFQLIRHLDDVIEICSLLDGLPLGIVIAASRVQYISPAEILVMLKTDLLAVETSHSDLPLRHQTFRNLLDHMMSRLSEDELDALMNLAIFRGDFSHQAALAIADINMQLFTKLVNKSLIHGTGNFRFAMHNVLKELFADRLQSSKNMDRVLSRYHEYFVHRCYDLYQQNLPLHEQMTAIDRDYHNIWYMDGLSEHQRQSYVMRIAPTLRVYWVNRGYHDTGVTRLLQEGSNNPDIPLEIRIRGMVELARILERTGHDAEAQAICEQTLSLEADSKNLYVRARSWRILSEVHCVRGEYAEAQQYLEEILNIEDDLLALNQPGIEVLLINAYQDLGHVFMSQAYFDTARHYFNIAIFRAEDAGETFRADIVRSFLIGILYREGHYEDAYTLAADILPNAIAADNQTMMIVFASHKGKAALHLNRCDEAYSILKETLQLAIRIDRRRSIVCLLETFSDLAIRYEQANVAIQLLAFTTTMREKMQYFRLPYQEREVQAILDDSQFIISEGFECLWSIGAKMNRAVAMKMALSLQENTLKNRILAI